MKVILIGAGNLATNLGKALGRAGHAIVQVYSRTLQSAVALAEQLGCGATNDLHAVRNDADIYIISVKDSVLAEVVGQVCAGKGDKIFLHTAGSMPLGVFEGCAENYGVLYPMQTFSKSREVAFSEIPCFIEANNAETLAEIGQLARSVSDHVVTMSTEDRRYLHLAAVWTCNFTNHCYDIAARLLADHDIDFRYMLPLIDETARKVHTMTPRQAQTGPAVRYDANVIAAQMKLMEQNPLQQQLYEWLSKSIHQASEEGEGQPASNP